MLGVLCWHSRNVNGVPLFFLSAQIRAVLRFPYLVCCFTITTNQQRRNVNGIRFVFNSTESGHIHDISPFSPSASYLSRTSAAVRTKQDPPHTHITRISRSASMASLPLVNHHHHHLTLMCSLQSTTPNTTHVFTDSPSSTAPLPPSLLSHRHPIAHFTTPKSYDEVSEQSTAREETWEVKQESQLNFEAWRLGVEANTLRNWTVVPPEFVEYVKKYMVGSGSQYVRDLHMVANESIAYANSLKLSGDGKDAWVFDVDETLLSSLPYFAAHQYGGEGMEDDAFIQWASLSESPPLPASCRLYAHLLGLGFKIFLLTGRYDYERNATEKNLVRAGYHSWEALLLREPKDYRKSAEVYKSERRLKIEQDGFRIRGNSSDQWSDLTGYAVGDRTFKLPNPMYYVG